jgi:hypothetical protein
MQENQDLPYQQSASAASRRRPFAPADRGMSEDDTEALRQRIQELHVEHRDLDDVIARLAADPLQDDLQIRRLKKRKLYLKDTIARLESRLIPDLEA